MTVPANPAQQLVIGSLDRSDDYQRVLTELQAAGASAQGEMVDRLLDNGESECFAQATLRSAC